MLQQTIDELIKTLPTNNYGIPLNSYIKNNSSLLTSLQNKVYEFDAFRRFEPIINKLNEFGLGADIGNATVPFGSIGKEFESIRRGTEKISNPSKVLNNILLSISTDRLKLPYISDFLNFLRNKINNNEKLGQLESKTFLNHIRSNMESDFPNEFYKKSTAYEYNKLYKSRLAEKALINVKEEKNLQNINKFTALDKSTLPVDRPIYTESKYIPGTTTVEKTYLPARDIPFIQNYSFFRQNEKYFHPDAIMSRTGRAPSKEESDTYINLRNAFEDWYKRQQDLYKEIGSVPPKSLNVK